jgi:thioredoxin reductase (NADPH)
MADEMEIFPTLEDADLELIGRHGTTRSVEAGEYLYRAGDASYDFHVIVSGTVDIIVDDDGSERLITSQGDRKFLGELSLLTGMRALVSARVVEPGEVIAVAPGELQRMLANSPRLGDTILRAFMARRSELLSGAASAIRVVGSRYSPASHQIREFLSRNRIPYEWHDADDDDAVEALLRHVGVTPADLPVVIATGSVLRNPTPGELAEYLGLTLGRLPGRCFDLVVVGGGPAGLAAAVYGVTEGLRTLGVDMAAIGGQAGTSSRIDNYLGFPFGISGGDLTQRATAQAQKFGAHFSSPCAATGLREEAGHLVVRLSDGADVAGRAVIVASGARYRRLDAARLDDFEDAGVYYAATTIERDQCAGQPVAVAGGGNSAGQGSLFLAEKGCHVTIIVRAPDLAASMSRYLIDRIAENELITVRTDTKITSLEGDAALAALRLAGTSGEEVLACTGLFSFIGADPASEWLSGCAALDDRGFVLTDRALAPEHLDARWAVLGRQPLPYETSHPGLFAVGDVRAGSTKRVAAAVGEGSAAVGAVHEYLAFAR